MKKFFVSVALTLTVLLGSVFASDISKSFYVGGNIGGTSAKIDTGTSIKDFKPEIGLEFGYIINPEWRTYLGYSYTTPLKDNKDSVDYTLDRNHKFLLGLDWTPRFIGATKVVLGGYTGAKLSKLKVDSVGLKENFKGYLLGVRTGLLVEVDESIETGVLFKVDRTWYGKADLLNTKPKEVDYGFGVFVNYKF